MYEMIIVGAGVMILLFNPAKGTKPSFLTRYGIEQAEDILSKIGKDPFHLTK